MKTKAAIIIILTLVIGFVLGMLTSAQIRHSKMREMRTFFSGKDFAEKIIEVVQPDEKQKAELESIMKNFDKTTRDLQIQFRNDFDSVSIVFKKDMDTLLTKEQLERVRDLEAKNREMMQKMRRSPPERSRHDSGPHGRPPLRPNDSHSD